MGAICVAMADGVVSVQPNNGGAGNMMTIQHGGGYTSVFMHGMPGGYIVTSGPVKQGQPIFKVGSTGMSSGPHLHLKFTFNGTYCLLSKIGIDVLKMGLPVRRYNAGCNAY
jgi:murein DD-endopeptidase MepM/ murein hydrolase activator NlpD